MRVSREDLVMLLASAMMAVGASMVVGLYLLWWADIIHALTA